MSVDSQQRAVQEARTSDQRRRCPECDGEVRPDGEDRVCAECGLVVDRDDFDRGPEWRRVDLHGETKGFGRAPHSPTSVSRHDGGLGSMVGAGRADTSWVGPNNSREIRLKVWQQRIRGGKTRSRNLRHAFSEIRRMASALDLPYDTRDLACQNYRRARDAGLHQNRGIEPIAAAVLWGAAREHRLSVTLDDIVEVARGERRELARAWSDVVECVDCNALPAQPAELVPRIVSELGLPDAIGHDAREVAKRVQDTAAASGKKPASIAAGAVYYADDRGEIRGVNQTEIADAADVSATSVRSGWRLVQEVIGDE